MSDMPLPSARSTLVPPSPGMLRAYIRRLAEDAVARQRSEFEAVRTPSDWRRLSRRYLNDYQTAVGPLPARTPLKSRTTGVIKRPGVTIEKIVFESRPRFYVTGNLYLPDPPRHARAPAVLLLSGHYEQGKLDPQSPHQQMGLTLAERGVVTLAIDPLGQGERRFYLAAGGGAAEDCCSEHCLLGIPCLLTGTNLAQYMVWDAIRAVDYLVARPEVDPKRIAATGVSGGGTQTALLAPLEPRLALAAPTCYVTARLDFLGQAADAEQCFIGGISRGLDHSTMIALFAPRPYQVQAATQDFFPIRGARESTAVAKHIYEVLGAGDRLRLAEDTCDHRYSENLQRDFYAWLQRWFGVGDGAPAQGQLLDPQQLLCTATGQVKTSYPDARWVGDFNRARADAVAPKRSLPSDPRTLTAYQRSVRAAIRRVLAGSLSLAEGYAPVHEVESERRSGETVTEKVWLGTEDGITIECAITRPAGADRRPAVLFLEDTPSSGPASRLAAEHEEAEQLRSSLVRAGVVAVGVQVRGAGPSRLSGPAESAWQFHFGPEPVLDQDALMCGTSLFGGRVVDTLQCLKYVAARDDVDPRRISLVGWSQGGLVAMTASALDTRVSRCAAIGSLVSYRSLVDAECFSHPRSTFVWNVLPNYDLPELAACIAPRPLLISRPVDAVAQSVSGSRLWTTYAVTRAAYLARGADSSLVLDSAGRELLAWLLGC